MKDLKPYAKLVKSHVSALDAGRRLGLDINRDGRCPCPFHNGVDRNMKLYDGERGYHCFVCHEHGDVIALVQALNSCTFVEAIQWLSDEFHLGVDTHAPIDRETRQRAARTRRMREEMNLRAKQTDMYVYDTFLNAADFCRMVERLIEDNRPETPDDEWNKAFCAALNILPEAKELCVDAEMQMMEEKR